MPQIPARAWLLTLLSALLQIAIFPIAGPLPFWRAALAWIALVPLLLALVENGKDGKPLSIRNATVLGYLCGVLWYAGNCYWIYQTMYLYGGLPKPLALVILILFALYLGLYHALFAAIISLLRNSSLGINGALLLTPFAWVAVELARARITYFPWDLLGYSQIDNAYLDQLAPIAGVMAMSFVVALVNESVVEYILDRSKWRTPAAALAFAVILYVGGRHKSLASVQTPAHTAVMMQENMEVGAVGGETTPLTLTEELEQFSAASLHPDSIVRFSGQYVWDTSNPRTNPTVIIWPEAPSHLISSDPFFRATLGELAREAKAPAIIGSLGVDRSMTPARGYYLYDSASFFNSVGDYAGRYDKIHLVPWGEYVPFKQFFSFADKLTEGVGDMDRGYKRDVLTLDGHAYGTFVCYESIFGDEVRQFAANGAEVLVQISDDGWYGDTGAPWQHLNMARMRAIENHRWLLRSTNTGITTAIRPDGRMDAQAPRHTRGAYAFHFDFTPATTQTFYTRHGDWFAYLCALITALAIAFTFIPNQKST